MRAVAASPAVLTLFVHSVEGRQNTSSKAVNPARQFLTEHFQLTRSAMSDSLLNARDLVELRFRTRAASTQ